jgi:D-glycero-D-manno-heptose 1,7-bisphosphate phosphatase
MKGVILDRDGTLIDFYRDVELGVVTPAFHPDHVQLLPSVDAGFALAIATNQPDAAKGHVPVDAIHRVNARLLEALEKQGVHIAALEVCLHHPEGAPGGAPELIGPCDCRKPAPGLLTAIVMKLGLDKEASWMLGDTLADEGAARAAGVRFALLANLERCDICPFVGAAPQERRRLDGAARGRVGFDVCAPIMVELARAIIAA